MRQLDATKRGSIQDGDCQSPKSRTSDSDFKDLVRRMEAAHDLEVDQLRARPASAQAAHDLEVDQLRARNEELENQLAGKLSVEAARWDVKGSSCRVSTGFVENGHQNGMNGAPQKTFQINTIDQPEVTEVETFELEDDDVQLRIAARSDGFRNSQSSINTLDEAETSIRKTQSQSPKKLIMLMREHWGSVDSDEDEDEARPNIFQKRNVDLGIQESVKSATQVVDLGSHNRCNKVMQLFMTQPQSPYRMTWDIIGAFLLFYDIIFLPMVAFDLEGLAFFDTMDFVTMLFWSADMISSFLVGFQREGVIVMNPKAIAKNYLKTWFMIDLVIVTPDWIMTVAVLVTGGSGASGGQNQALKSLRALRVLRTVRLLRLLKLKRLLVMLQDFVNSEYMSVIASIVKLLIFMLLINHMICCMWYFLGVYSKDRGEDSWITAYKLHEDSVDYQYLTSLHWSLTQFTPASMSVQPQNSAERIFCIMVIVSGMVVFSSFISNITSAMTQLRGLQADKANHYWMLRRYLRERKIPHGLTFRIQRYVEFATQSQKDVIPDSKVTYLALLSDRLKEELRGALTVPSLKPHPVFRFALSVSDTALGKVATNACTKKNLAFGDCVFSEGQVADGMSIVDIGKLRFERTAVAKADADGDGLVNLEEAMEAGVTAEQYLSADLLGEGNLTPEQFTQLLARISAENKEKGIEQKVTDIADMAGAAATEVVDIDDGAWIAEIALWIQWKHRGSLVATAECQTIVIDADKFGTSIMECVPAVRSIMADYAFKFHRWALLDPSGILDVMTPASHFDTLNDLLPHHKRGAATHFSPAPRSSLFRSGTKLF